MSDSDILKYYLVILNLLRSQRFDLQINPIESFNLKINKE